LIRPVSIPSIVAPYKPFLPYRNCVPKRAPDNKQRAGGRLLTSVRNISGLPINGYNSLSVFLSNSRVAVKRTPLGLSSCPVVANGEWKRIGKTSAGSHSEKHTARVRPIPYVKTVVTILRRSFCLSVPLFGLRRCPVGAEER